MYRGSLSFSFLLVLSSAWPHFDSKRPCTSPGIRQTTGDGIWGKEILGKHWKNLPYKVYSELLKPWKTKIKRKGSREQRQHKEISFNVLLSSRVVVGNIPSLFQSPLKLIESGSFQVELAHLGWKWLILGDNQLSNQWLQVTCSVHCSQSLLFSCPSPTSTRKMVAQSNPYPTCHLFATFPVVYFLFPQENNKEINTDSTIWKSRALVKAGDSRI